MVFLSPNQAFLPALTTLGRKPPSGHGESWDIANTKPIEILFTEYCGYKWCAAAQAASHCTVVIDALWQPALTCKHEDSYRSARICARGRDSA
ncbi:hypothetical protein ABRP17_012275 [Stenotrophomonas sp. WHRI 8082]|uniref:hypothetical protein n=1 Tax=Stenotrophomonas sp. WHRI 8082 TaxID=3162571 RepID=UPI0032EE5382